MGRMQGTLLREAQDNRMNVQVAWTIYGKLAWISNPVNGSRHDNYCLGDSTCCARSTQRTG